MCGAGAGGGEGRESLSVKSKAEVGLEAFPPEIEVGGTTPELSNLTCKLEFGEF